jgi:hypothetical protein
MVVRIIRKRRICALPVDHEGEILDVLIQPRHAGSWDADVQAVAPRLAVTVARICRRGRPPHHSTRRFAFATTNGRFEFRDRPMSAPSANGRCAP